jgi:hypothetical protein
MRIKQTVKQIVAGAVLVFGILTVVTPLAVSAATCGGVDTSIIGCTQGGGDNADVKDTGVWGLLLLGINILTAGVGVVAVAGIVYASILYSASGGDAANVKKAMTIISDIVIGVVAYALMYATLNFLVPGGLFNS